MKFGLIHRYNLAPDDFKNDNTWTQHYSGDEIDFILSEGYDRESLSIIYSTVTLPTI